MTAVSTPPPTELIAMIVEDEGLVRMVAAECLTDAGFVVIEAPDAQAALAVL